VIREKSVSQLHAMVVERGARLCVSANATVDNDKAGSQALRKKRKVDQWVILEVR
jgi:hypothetical protein